ncbi:MAG: hypothetical protein ACR2NU_00560, partial [Aeoliella sp.]
MRAVPTMIGLSSVAREAMSPGRPADVALADEAELVAEALVVVQVAVASIWIRWLVLMMPVNHYAASCWQTRDCAPVTCRMFARLPISY